MIDTRNYTDVERSSRRRKVVGSIQSHVLPKTDRLAAVVSFPIMGVIMLKLYYSTGQHNFMIMSLFVISPHVSTNLFMKRGVERDL